MDGTVVEHSAGFGDLLRRSRDERPATEMRRGTLDAKLGKPRMKPNGYGVRAVAVRALAIPDGKAGPQPVTSDSH